MSSYSISSSRPKTSAGSRATSARGVRRPTTASRNVNERPLSRTSMTADGNLVQRAVSRTGIMQPPRTSLGERVQSRAGTATQSTTSIVRPPTSGFSRNVAPPGSSMRPITQQGLSGVRAPPSRIGANRQILDTSYYISLLRQKSSELSSEIEMLRKELDRGERDQQNLMIYERRAEEEANTIRDLQGRLLDCNMIVDRLNTNWDLGELKEELNELRLRNDEAEKSLHELFADRQQSEKEIEEIQKQIDSEKAKNGDIISDMDISVREQFEELKQEALRLNEDYSTKEQQLSELNQRKEELDEEMANSTLKQRAMLLHERLAEMEAKKAAISEEMNAEGTPQEQRERLKQIVIKTTDEVNAMQKQIDSIMENIDQCNEELREFESEYDGIIGEKSEKYRELKMKEIQIDEFLDSYEQLKIEQENRVVHNSEDILRFLEIISLNCTKTDLTTAATSLDASAVMSFNDPTISSSQLQDLHVRLQEELITLEENERKLRSDMSNFVQRMHEMNNKMEEFEDRNALRADIEQKKQGLQHRRDQLNEILPAVESKNQQLTRDLANAQAQLNDNDEYTTLKNVQKKWQYIEQNSATLREAAAVKDAETNYSRLKEEAMRLQSEYNTSLVLWTKPR